MDALQDRLGQMVAVGGKVEINEKAINKFRQKNPTVSVQYFVLILSTTWLLLNRLIDIFYASVSRSTFMKIQVHMQWGA